MWANVQMYVQVPVCHLLPWPGGLQEDGGRYCMRGPGQPEEESQKQEQNQGRLAKEYRLIRIQIQDLNFKKFTRPDPARTLIRIRIQAK